MFDPGKFMHLLKWFNANCIRVELTKCATNLVSVETNAISNTPFSLRSDFYLKTSHSIDDMAQSDNGFCIIYY